MSSINGTCTDCSTDSCLITGFLYKTLWQEVDPTNTSQGTKFNGNVTVTGCLKTNCIEPYSDAENQVEVESNLLITPDMTSGNTENPIRNFELKNRNLAICDANGNGPVGYPAITTDPRWGYSYMLVHGGSDFRDIVRIRKSQNYNSIFNQFGAALQITAPDQAVNEDITIQLGRDFVSQNNAAIMAFKYAGNGSPLNTFRIDTNGNQASPTPSFVITMPPPPQLGKVGIHIAQPQYDFDVQGDTAIRNINTGNTIMYVDAANGDFTLNAADNTRMMYLDGNSTSFNIGKGSGTVQGLDCIAVGINAGLNQGDNSIAIGNNAGQQQQTNSLAIGGNAGKLTQGIQCVAIGFNAGNNTQGENAISIGVSSGKMTQATNCIAIGNSSGEQTQATNAVAIGSQSGRYTQGTLATSLGFWSGKHVQGANAVALGANAGEFYQGTSAIAIGYLAGQTSQHANSIILNSSGATLNSSATNQFLVSNMRTSVTTGGQEMFYNPTTKEIHYNNYRVAKPVMVLQKSNQSIPNNTPTRVNFDLIVFGAGDVGTSGTSPGFTNSGVPFVQDANGYFTNNSGVTVTITASASVQWDSIATGYRYIYIGLYDASNTLLMPYATQLNPAQDGQNLNCCQTFGVANGQKIAVVLTQTQGNALNAIATRLSILPN